MKGLGNIDKIANEFTWKDTTGLVTKELAKSVGSQKIYVNLDSVPLNAYSTKYHSHTHQEEFFLIVSGSGILRVNHQEQLVNSGDFFAKLAGQGIAHTFFNPNQEPLVILDIGSVEKKDTCYYPDEDVYLHKATGKAQAVKNGQVLSDWTSIE